MLSTRTLLTSIAEEAARVVGLDVAKVTDVANDDGLGQDMIAIRPIMNLTLTYDHRLVDGALAGRFLRDLRERLESWDETNY